MMPIHRRSGPLGLICCLAATAAVYSAEPEPTKPSADNDPRPVMRATIEISAATVDLPQASARDRDDAATRPTSGDGGESLRGLPGVSLGRMGGHGLEPVIRGSGATTLNVLVDGAFIHGGCPNRMDPPSSYAADLDRVVVLRGLQTLLWGSGGSAGTILFERRPAPTSDTWSAEATVAGTSWSASPSATIALAAGTSGLGLNLSASRVDEDSYEDGGGDEVRSSYRSDGLRLDLAWAPGASSRLEVGGELARTRDALFPGAGMDSPSSEGLTGRARWVYDPDSGAIRRLRAEAAYATVDHVMDNYSLRPLTAPMAMRAPTEVDTLTARLLGDAAPTAELDLTFGVDVEQVDRTAIRFAGPGPAMVTRSQAILWPEVTTRRAGLVVEGTLRVSTATRLRGGLRYDHFTADAAAADSVPDVGGPSPRQLWTQTYGSTSDAWDDDDWSALLRLEHDLRRGVTLFAGASRSIRVADATERFLASNASMPPMRWIGNPELAPERHHQLDLGLTWSGDAWRLDLTGFFDRADDLILRDRARGQSGVLAADGRSVYRNVGAERYGLESTLELRLGEHWSLAAAAAWLRATDTDDDRPLAQTPPLEGSLTAAWTRGPWRLAATGRGASSQDRVDDDPMTGSGLDPGPTPSWTALDLAVTVALGAGFRLEGGVENVFDRTYAVHLARSNTFDPDLVRVNEPGRTVWLRAGWSGRR